MRWVLFIVCRGLSVAYPACLQWLQLLSRQLLLQSFHLCKRAAREPCSFSRSSCFQDNSHQSLYGTYVQYGSNRPASTARTVVLVPGQPMLGSFACRGGEAGTASTPVLVPNIAANRRGHAPGLGCVLLAPKPLDASTSDSRWAQAVLPHPLISKCILERHRAPLFHPNVRQPLTCFHPIPRRPSVPIPCPLSAGLIMESSSKR